MHGELGIEHSEVGRASSRLGEHGDEFVTALRYLRERAGASSWGDDGLFGAFVAAYNRSALTAVEAYGHLGGTVGGTGDALAVASRRVSDAEVDAGRQIARAHDEPGLA
ncbi:hypothetical protein [Microbispora sp. CA-102843]|uniref:hypothetical protein n=1 Tax=Microbispora sp. CA-102843 TaxID=3239952 RepID=UPI003D8E9F3D